MLEIYAKEYVGIGKYLKQSGAIHKGFIICEKAQMEKLLDKNKYDTAANKLKIWKALGWIDADKDRRVTKRIYDGTTESYKPFVKMKMEVIDTLERLLKH